MACLILALRFLTTGRPLTVAALASKRETQTQRWTQVFVRIEILLKCHQRVLIKNV